MSQTISASSPEKKLFSKSNAAGDPFNFARKTFHLVGLIVPAIFLHNLLESVSPVKFADTSRSVIFYICSVAGLLLLIIELLRFRYPFWQNLFIKVAGKLLKEKEHNKMHGSVPYVLALAIVLGFFPKEIAILSILFLTFGDPLAAYIGGKYGTIRFYNGKSLQGFLGGVLGAFVSGLAFLIYVTIVFPESGYKLWDQQGILVVPWLMVVLGAIIAFGLEFVSHEGLLDDNMTIPVGASLFMTFFYTLIAQTNLSQAFYNVKALIFPL